MRIQLSSSPETTFFTSDPHYSHRNLCSATSRWSSSPAIRRHSSMEEMNDALVSAINSRVGEEDTLWILGDVAFSGASQVLEYRRRIVCRNVHLVRGNHDHHVPVPGERDFDEKRVLHDAFSSVCDYAEIQMTNSPLIVATHYPLASWNKDSRNLHLHGHLHSRHGSHVTPGAYAGVYNRVDVGVDGSPGYAPYSVSELLKLAQRTDSGGSTRH